MKQVEKLLAIVGPTGTGKTDLALKLAKKFNGEIISADSRQIYKEMDIGTGKELSNDRAIEKKEGYWLVDGIQVNLYDIINPDQTFSVAEYQQLAYKKIEQIQERNKLPILVGGTGLYIRAVTQGLKFPQVAPDKKIREKLEKKHFNVLLKELEMVDYSTYQGIDKSNKRRVIRALEVYYKTGNTISSLAKKFQPGFENLAVGLTGPKEVLYTRADSRIDDWISLGFIDEVKKLSKKYQPSLPSMTSLGYRQIASYLDGKISLEEAVKRMKFDHHGFIRRQITWFKKEPNIHWFDISNLSYEKEVVNLTEDWLED